MQASDNQAIIQRFYAAFQNRDYRTMQSLYHRDATFSDPVFRQLNAHEVCAMWEMLLSRSKDIRITFEGVTATATAGSCRWEAYYTLSKTKRPVHNVVDAVFEFRDGLIVDHRDTFNFWRWSRQAMGTPGLLGGWTFAFHNKISDTARQGLDKFLQRHV